MHTYYLREAPEAGIPHTVPSCTTPFIVFHYGDAALTTIGGREKKVESMAVCGMITRPYSFRYLGSDARLFAIELSRAGLYSMFGERGDSFTEASLDLADLVPARKRSPDTRPASRLAIASRSRRSSPARARPHDEDLTFRRETHRRRSWPPAAARAAA